MEKLFTLPKFGDRGQHVEILQRKLVELGFNNGNIDGSFGGQTKKALQHFQIGKGLDENGILNDDLLLRLGLVLETELSDNPLSAITSIVDNSGISKISWENGSRGHAPYGYYYGMALCYAQMYQRSKSEDPIIAEIAKPLGIPISKDTLSKWNLEFEKIGLNNDSEQNRLRNVFILMFGLGMMESSGRYCCGWDRGKLTGWGKPSKIIPLSEISANNSEAGLFQTSYDVFNSMPLEIEKTLLQIIQRYKGGEDGFLEYFSKGAYCGILDGENVGKGKGFEFQKLAKESPAFTVEFNALAIRYTASHWNPIIKIGDSKDGLQLKLEVNNLLLKVEDYVDDNTVAYVPITAISTLPSIEENLKDRALDLADTLGQKEQLQKLFDFAPNSRANFWAIVDFNKPSNERRLFIFNLNVGEVKKYLVSHGVNSGDLVPNTFSNKVNSNQSSLGIYKVAEVYIGKHGRSLKIDGEQPSNSNARTRAIVIHDAPYVSSKHAGRSEGCFVVNKDYIKEVIDNLRDGSYLIAWHK
jgi:hypothetical protein